MKERHDRLASDIRLLSRLISRGQAPCVTAMEARVWPGWIMYLMVKSVASEIDSRKDQARSWEACTCTALRRHRLMKEALRTSGEDPTSLHSAQTA